MNTEQSNEKEKIFKRRLDFYWQFIAIYSVALLLYAFFKSFLIDKKISLAIADPLSILFLAFVVIALLSVVYQEFLKQKIVIGEDYIVFKSRFKEKKYSLSDFVRIYYSRDRRIRIKKPVRIVKIFLKNRRFPLRIRPSAYWEDQLLADTLIKFKKKISN